MNEMTHPGPDSGTALRRPHVKICGLTSEAMIETVLSRGAREVGFVHFPDSPRHLPVETIALLKAHVAGRARTTVVTVDPDDALIDRLSERVRPDCIQLHGRESPARVAAVSARSGVLTMKALAIGSREDLAQVDLYRPVADRLLLDAKAPRGAVLPGGNGVSFDWSLLSELDPSIDYLLSGGLNPENVEDAVRRVRPWGIDVSSGVERAPGIKDAGLIHRFFDALDAASTPDPEGRKP